MAKPVNRGLNNYRLLAKYCRENNFLELYSDVGFLLCQEHRILPQLCSGLSQHGSDVAETTRNKIQHFCLGQTRETLAQITLLQKISGKFAEKNISMVVLKGVVLSHLLYGDYTSRQSKDIDILIHERDIDNAHAIMVQLGFIRILPEFELTPKQKRFYIARRKDFSYLHHETNVEVELHWHLFDLGISELRLCENDIWQNLIAHDFFANRIYIFASDDYLIYLCMHGAFSGWRRLRWSLDLWIYLQKHGAEFNWDEIVSKVKKWRVMKCLAQGMLLMCELFAYPLPLLIAKYINDDRSIRVLVNQVLYDSAQLTAEHSFKLNFYFFRSLPSYFSALRCLVKKPGQRMPEIWRAYRFPDSLFWLYYPLALATFLFDNLISRPIIYAFRKFGRERCAT